MRAGPAMFLLHSAKILTHSKYSVERNQLEGRENEGEPRVREMGSLIIALLFWS